MFVSSPNTSAIQEIYCVFCRLFIYCPQFCVRGLKKVTDAVLGPAADMKGGAYMAPHLCACAVVGYIASTFMAEIFSEHTYLF